MATFFGEVVSYRSRAVDEDEDDDEEDITTLDNRFRNIEWEYQNPKLTKGTIKHHCKLLVLGIGPVACGFLRSSISDSARALLKGVLHTEQRLDDVTKNVSTDILQLYSNSTDVVIGLHENLLEEEEDFSICLKLFSCLHMEDLKVVVLCSQHMSTYVNDYQGYEGPLLRCVKSESFSSNLPAPLLEQPNILQGFAAAVMSYCQVHSVPACLCVLYSDVLDVDSVNMGAFESLLRCPSLAQHLKPLSQLCYSAYKKAKNGHQLGNLYL